MVDVNMPQMGESIAEGTVSVWLVELGQRVEVDQPLVQVSTDKADIDVPSPVSGILKEIIVPAGKTVPVGNLIARIDETTAKIRQAPAEAQKPATVAKVSMKPQAPPDGFEGYEIARHEGLPAAEAMKEVGPAEVMGGPPEIERGHAAVAEEVKRPDMSGFYSPAVTTLAATHGIDLSKIRGTGQDGRVTRADVLKAMGGQAPQPPPSAPPVKEARPAAAEETPAAPAETGTPVYKPPVYEVEPGDTVTEFTRMRRIIAEHMVYSKRTAAHVTTFAEADMHRVTLVRDARKDAFKSEHGVSLTFLPFVMLATIRALKDYPLMNSVVQDDKILTKKMINLGVAVDSERGLLVPVIKDAGDMDLAALAMAVGELSAKVRDRKIMPEELAGGTFTVSNPGRKGNLFGTPIISQPQVGVVRMGEVVKRSVVREVSGEDAVTVAPMMYVSLSYDHRVVDGLTANEFLHRIKEYLEAGEIYN